MWQPVFMISGYFISLLGFAMLIPAFVDIHYSGENWSPFFSSSIVVLFFGLSLFLANKSEIKKINLHQGYLLTVISWGSVALFSSLPFVFYNVAPSFIDALFEASSGITATGATIFSDVEALPKAILLWRSMLNGLGGIGIVIFAVAMLPFLGVGGMQAFQRENSDIGDKFMPKMSYIAKRIIVLYVFFLISCAFSYYLAGMGRFDAINHALTTTSTGGFSTKNNSFEFFDSAKIEMVAILFMVLASLPMSFYLLLFKKNGSQLLKSAQVRAFLKILVFYILCMTSWLVYTDKYDFITALRSSAFNIISITTTTGYASTDYSLWGSFAWSAFLIFALTGGCTGSTTGSIKIFRWQAIIAYLKKTLNTASEPNMIFSTKINNVVLDDDLISSVLSFMSAYVFCVVLSTLLISLTGVSLDIALSGVIACITNAGPGLGEVVGPLGNYSSLSDFAKLVLSFVMIVGRLDVLTVLVIFAPHFWKK